MARSGIWYTNDIELNDSTLQAPKLFRVCNQVKLNNIHFSDAQETLWKCNQVMLKNVQANGDYFGMNSTNLYIDHLDLVGNYCFDGAKNVGCTIRDWFLKMPFGIVRMSPFTIPNQW